MQVLRTSAFVGARFGDYSVAVGPHFDAGTLAFDRAIDFIAEEGFASIETKATGIGVSASVFGRPLPAVDVGFSYASRTKLAFDGFADFTAPPEFSGTVEDSAVRADVTLPDRFRLGARWRATDDLAVLADVELTLWNTVDALRLDFDSDVTDDIVQPRDWSATVTPRAGVVWSALPYVDVRGGLYVDPSPVPNATVGPSSPDSTRVGLTAGAGLALIDEVGIDLGYQLVVFTGADAEGESMPGIRYGGVVHLLGASLSARL
jgi:long-chain fatty acid transport protein